LVRLLLLLCTGSLLSNACLHAGGDDLPVSATSSSDDDDPLEDGGVTSLAQIPLHAAVFLRRAGAVQELLAMGANVEARDQNKHTPLHCAATVGSVRIAKLLVEAGASLEARDAEGRTPLSRAAISGNHRLVQYLIEAGARVDAADNDGDTALHYAATHGCVLATAMLIGFGANVRAVNASGNTPLHYALGKEHEVLVNMLLILGGQVDAENKNGQTPMAFFLNFTGQEAALRCYEEERARGSDDRSCTTSSDDDGFRLFPEEHAEPSARHSDLSDEGLESSDDGCVYSDVDTDMSGYSSDDSSSDGGTQSEGEYWLPSPGIRSPFVGGQEFPGVVQSEDEENFLARMKSGIFGGESDGSDSESDASYASEDELSEIEATWFEEIDWPGGMAGIALYLFLYMQGYLEVSVDLSSGYYS